MFDVVADARFSDGRATRGSPLLGVPLPRIGAASRPIREVPVPVLANVKHELFARKLAAGDAILPAYVAAGFKPDAAAASRLTQKIQSRVDEIKAETKTAGPLAVTIERVLQEYARIAFADIRKVIDWVGELVTEEERPDRDGVRVVKNMVSNHVRLRSAAAIDDDIAAAISEVRHSNAGGVSVKLHSKLAALDALADHLGIAKPQRAEPADRNGVPAETRDLSPYEAGRRIAFTLERARRARNTNEEPREPTTE